MKIEGRVWKFGDNVNTDEIIAAGYLITFDLEELGRHCLEGIEKNFSKKIRRGDIILAGRNFGCGSSREHAPLAIKGCGIACVIAASFARIFYRNAINIGLPIVISQEAQQRVKQHDLLKVDTQKGIIYNLSQKKSYKTDKFAEFMQKIIEAGGLLNWIKIRKDYIE